MPVWTNANFAIITETLTGLYAEMEQLKLRVAEVEEKLAEVAAAGEEPK
jgi:hypothetical protein|tara:strand:+ start:8696 stop:8842 length:147 start_codon:yes stop_codon:yes gene_type:complete